MTLPRHVARELLRLLYYLELRAPVFGFPERYVLAHVAKIAESRGAKDTEELRWGLLKELGDISPEEARSALEELEGSKDWPPELRTEALDACIVRDRLSKENVQTLDEAKALLEAIANKK